ncbi:MAG: hypothetical protein KGL39_24260 [Patescibacteria group bacterium]|nr:hypothetical protein [Patescibacteria group bacterium]
MKFTAPDNGCLGVQMPDGTKYDANRSGTFEVEDPVHVGQLLGNEHLRSGWLGGGKVSVSLTTSVPDRYCLGTHKGKPCNFNLLPTTRICPRCGSRTPERA